MPFEALSAKARQMVPVGAIDSRWLLRMPWRGSRRGSPRAAAARTAGREVLLGVEQRKGALLPRQPDAWPVGDVAHRPRSSAATARASVS